MFESIEQLIESLNDMYDIESLEFDFNNNNVDLDNPEIERYFKPKIVSDSITNGQFKQAVKQFNQFDISCNDLTGLISHTKIAEFSNRLKGLS